MEDNWRWRQIYAEDVGAGWLTPLTVHDAIRLSDSQFSTEHSDPYRPLWAAGEEGLSLDQCVLEPLPKQ